MKDSHGAANVNSAQVTITVTAPDLTADALSATNTQAKQGQKIPITATITNQGDQNAGLSYTGFTLDGKTSIGQVATPAIPSHSSVNVTLNWDTSKVSKGTHSITATADVRNQIVETDETNNTSGALTIYIQGNKTK